MRRFPWPQRWAGQPPGAAVLIAVVLALLVPLAVAMAVSDDPSDPRALVVYVAAPAALGLAVLVLRTRVRRRRPRTGRVRVSLPAESPTPGLAVPYRTDVAVLWVAVAAYVCVLGVALVVAGAAGWGSGVAAPLPTLLLGVLLVAATAPALVAVVRGRLRPGVLVLTPAGVVHRSWGDDLSGPWARVTGVVPSGGPAPAVLVTMATAAATGPDAPAAGLPGSGSPVVRTRTAGSTGRKLAPHIAVDTTATDLDPVLLLETVRFYAAHPDRRAELGTPAAVERVRTGDLPAG